MSRRCRPSLMSSAGGAGGDSSFSSGCGCGRASGSSTPCEEPLLYGPLALREPGLETHIDLTGGGPEGDEIPGAAAASRGGDFPMEWTDGEDILENGYHGWRAGTNELEPDFYGGGQQRVERWWVDTTNPKTGTYHLRTMDSYDNTVPVQPEFVFPLSLSAINFWACARRPSDGKIHPYTLRCGAGDLIVIECQSMYVDISAESWGLGSSDPIVPGITMDAKAFALDQGSSTTFAVDRTLTSAYALYSAGLFILNDSLVQAGITAFSSGSPPDDFVEVAVDADDFRISVWQAGATILLCAFAGLITIDNDTTETSFLE